MSEVKKATNLQAAKVTDRELDKAAMTTKEMLDKEPKVRIKIAASEGDTSDVPVVLNGYLYQIKRGEYVDVPESIAKIIEASQLD